MYSELAVCIFTLVGGVITLYLSFRRNGIGWAVISTVLLFSNMLMSANIPFMTSGSQIVATSANVVLIGLNMMFGFVALIRCVFMMFDFYKK